jgi:hypothetical protein
MQPWPSFSFEKSVGQLLFFYLFIFSLVHSSCSTEVWPSKIFSSIYYYYYYLFIFLKQTLENSQSSKISFLLEPNSN